MFFECVLISDKMQYSALSRSTMTFRWKLGQFKMKSTKKNITRSQTVILEDQKAMNRITIAFLKPSHNDQTTRM